MNEVPIEAGLILAGILFMLGLVSVLVRRNIIFMLISVEIMLNSDYGSGRGISRTCFNSSDLSST